MKKLLFALLMMMSCLSMTSCVTTVEAQDDIYSSAVIDVDDIEMAITYGTPYIIDGMVHYYLYNNLYYYPFYTRGYWYYHVYRRPLLRYPSYWRPVPRSHWFKGGRFHNPHGFVGHHGYKPHHDNGVRPGRHRYSIGGERPSSTRSTVHRRPNMHNRDISSPRKGTTVRPNGGGAMKPQRNHSITPRSAFGGPSRPSAPSMSRGGSSPRQSTGGGHFGGRR